MHVKQAIDSLWTGESEEIYDFLKEVIVKEKSGLVKGYAVCSITDVCQRIGKIEETKLILKRCLKKTKNDFVKINIFTGLIKLGEEQNINNLLDMFEKGKNQNISAVINCIDKIIEDVDLDIVKKRVALLLKKETTYKMENEAKKLMDKIYYIEIASKRYLKTIGLDDIEITKLKEKLFG